MARRKIAYECPAYKIYEGKTGELDGYKDGDTIAIAYESLSHGVLHRIYTLGSVVGYAIKNCYDPFKQFEQAKERGHQLHWANPNCVSITSHERPQEFHFLVAHGETIRFHGKEFLIEAANNDHIKLTEV